MPTTMLTHPWQAKVNRLGLPRWQSEVPIMDSRSDFHEPKHERQVIPYAEPTIRFTLYRNLFLQHFAV